MKDAAAIQQSKATDLIEEASVWLVLCRQGSQNWGEILVPSSLVVEKWGAWISVSFKRSNWVQNGMPKFTRLRSGIDKWTALQFG